MQESYIVNLLITTQSKLVIHIKWNFDMVWYGLRFKFDIHLIFGTDLRDQFLLLNSLLDIGFRIPVYFLQANTSPDLFGGFKKSVASYVISGVEIVY